MRQLFSLAAAFLMAGFLGRPDDGPGLRRPSCRPDRGGRPARDLRGETSVPIAG